MINCVFAIRKAVEPDIITLEIYINGVAKCLQEIRVLFFVVLGFLEVEMYCCCLEATASWLLSWYEIKNGKIKLVVNKMFLFLHFFSLYIRTRVVLKYFIYSVFKIIAHLRKITFLYAHATKIIYGPFYIYTHLILKTKLFAMLNK